MNFFDAIVTGGSKGIGKEIAFEFGKQKHSVAILDLDEESGFLTEKEAKQLGLQINYFKIDISKTCEIDNWFEKNNQNLGRLSVLVNNAGIIQTKKFFNITEADWNSMLDTNLKSAFFMTKACAKIMCPIGRGSIVNVSSVSGRSGRPLQAHYSIAKAGLISLTKSSALAFAEHGIRVNAVCPSIVMTDMWKKIEEDKRFLENLNPGEAVSQFLQKIPLKRAAQPNEIADMVYFLCSEKAAYITGQAINVCGGLEMN